jgi:hypothetical protein
MVQTGVIFLSDRLAHYWEAEKGLVDGRGMNRDSKTTDKAVPVILAALYPPRG